MSKSTEKPPIQVQWNGTAFIPSDRESQTLAGAYHAGTRLNANFAQRIAVEWDGQTFRPADMRAVEQANGYLIGTYLDGEFTRPIGSEDRRSGLLRLWWAGLGLFAENIDDERWPTKRHAHNLILEELGFVQKIWRVDGSYRLEADSIAIDNMEDDDFDRLFERARAFVMTHWGFDPWDTWVAEKEAEEANKYRGRR